ncbi:hypothetical protein LT012_17635 [Vibrio cholerae]|nr:hypothetical protein [Vibrio cholerae]
MPNETAMYLAL